MGLKLRIAAMRERGRHLVSGGAMTGQKEPPYRKNEPLGNGLVNQCLPLRLAI